MNPDLLWSQDDDKDIDEILELAESMTRTAHLVASTLKHDPNIIAPALIFSAVSEVIGYADTENQDLLRDEELKKEMKIILDTAFRVLRGQPLALN
tara:strand:+ start:445 stop:732 length:288 start_codon:yes stop_codon:yes gene_type:complete